jgi:putative holliday junction resolvase
LSQGLSGRVVALDYGSARCGVAVSDPTRTLATPVEPVLAPATRRGFGRLVARIGELEAAVVVVGLPLSLSGRDSDQTRETRAFADRLRNRLNVPIEVYDERFTTKLAHRSGGATAEDSRAAAVLLEGWLSRERSAARASELTRPQAGDTDEPDPDNHSAGP